MQGELSCEYIRQVLRKSLRWSQRGREESRMAFDRQSEVEALYQKAQNILLHEMTESEQAFVNELGWDNRATLPETKFSRLKELVRRKCNKPSAA